MGAHQGALGPDSERGWWCDGARGRASHTGFHAASKGAAARLQATDRLMELSRMTDSASLRPAGPLCAPGASAPRPTASRWHACSAPSTCAQGRDPRDQGLQTPAWKARRTRILTQTRASGRSRPATQQIRADPADLPSRWQACRPAPSASAQAAELEGQGVYTAFLHSRGCWSQTK